MSDSIPNQNQSLTAQSTHPVKPDQQPNDRAERQESIKELYLYAVQRLNTERERFNRVDEKANKLAAVFVYVIGALLFFVKMIESNLPPKTVVDWILVVITSLSLFAAFFGWVVCVKTPALRLFVEPPFNAEVIKFFEKNRASDVRYAWAKQFEKAYEKNVATTNDKQLSLHFAISTMRIVVGALVLLSFLYLIKLSK